LLNLLGPGLESDPNTGLQACLVPRPAVVAQNAPFLFHALLCGVVTERGRFVVQTDRHRANRAALSKIVMLSLVTGMAFDGMYGDDDD
jgi:hypothetical protein